MGSDKLLSFFFDLFKQISILYELGIVYLYLQSTRGHAYKLSDRARTAIKYCNMLICYPKKLPVFTNLEVSIYYVQKIDWLACQASLRAGVL